MIRRGGRIGPGTGLCKLMRVRDNSLNFPVDRFQLRFLDACLGEEQLPQAQDRTARLPFLDFLARPVGEITHAFGMGSRAIGTTFEQRCALAFSSTLDGPLGSFKYR